jgi:hypothetical protein
VALTVGTTFVESTSQTSHSFSASIGTAAADRFVIVAAAAGSGSAEAAEITGITIGGNAATIHAYATREYQSAAIGSLVVPTGTTATVAITTADATSMVEAVVYQLTGAIFDPTGTGAGKALEAIALQCAAGASGILIGAAHAYTGPISTASNALGTVDLSGTDGGGAHAYYIGHSTGLSETAAYNVIFTNEGASVFHAAVMAAWKPTSGVWTKSRLVG